MEKISIEYIINFITRKAQVCVVQFDTNSGVVRTFGEEIPADALVAFLASGGGKSQSRIQLQDKTFDIWSTDKEGETLYVLKRVDDKVELENRLLYYARMKENEMILRELLHEIRTPLGTMRNYLHIVTEEMERYGGGRRKKDVALENLQAIHDEILRIDSMLSAFHGSWSEAGEEISSSDLGRETRFMEKIYRKVFDEKGIAFAVEGPGEGLIIAVPARAIRQVMANLISNAREAVDRGGSVWVRACDQDGKGVLEVGDNGEGIAGDLLPLLFKEPLDSHKGEGRGYGLWITARVVKKYGGSIHYEKLDGGSLFRVAFERKTGAGV